MGVPFTKVTSKHFSVTSQISSNILTRQGVSYVYDIWPWVGAGGLIDVTTKFSIRNLFDKCKKPLAKKWGRAHTVSYFKTLEQAKFATIFGLDRECHAFMIFGRESVSV